jgi:hypothetical protein
MAAVSAASSSSGRGTRRSQDRMRAAPGHSQGQLATPVTALGSAHAAHHATTTMDSVEPSTRAGRATVAVNAGTVTVLEDTAIATAAQSRGVSVLIRRVRTAWRDRRNWRWRRTIGECILVSPSGMVETPRLQAKTRSAK